MFHLDPSRITTGPGLLQVLLIPSSSWSCEGTAPHQHLSRKRAHRRAAPRNSRHVETEKRQAQSGNAFIPTDGTEGDAKYRLPAMSPPPAHPSNEVPTSPLGPHLYGYKGSLCLTSPSSCRDSCLPPWHRALSSRGTRITRMNLWPIKTDVRHAILMEFD